MCACMFSQTNICACLFSQTCMCAHMCTPMCYQTCKTLYELQNLSVNKNKIYDTPISYTTDKPSLTWVPQSRLVFGHLRRVSWPWAFGYHNPFPPQLGLPLVAMISCGNQESFFY